MSQKVRSWRKQHGLESEIKMDEWVSRTRRIISFSETPGKDIAMVENEATFLGVGGA